MTNMKNTLCLFEEGTTLEGMVSASQIQTFLACRRRWEYGYREGLRQKREREFLTVGKLCHVGMEAAMRRRWENPHAEMADLLRCGMDAMDEMWHDYMDVTDFLDEELPEQQDLLARAIDVFEEALDEFDPMRWVPMTVIKDGVPIPALELHFCVPCEGCRGLHGYIDAILRDDETGQVWCVDYKFRRTLAADDDERFSLQNAVYMMACRHMGVEVAGTMTWQRYNTPSAVPKFNKDGSVSRSKIKCTWPRYRRFIINAGLDPHDYAEMQDKLADVEMCRPTREVRSDEMVDNIWSMVVEPAAASITDALYMEDYCTPSLDPWTCRLCSFQSLCQARLRGYDEDYVRLAEYTVKDHRK